MSSIRPLFTITVLVVVGAYLYVKINDGPVRPHAGGHGAGDHSDDDVPPLASTSGGATLAQETAAPAWPAVDSAAPPAKAAVLSTPTNEDAATSTLPEVPQIPALPDLPQTTEGTPPTAQTAIASPIELPKNIPAAQYGDETGSGLVSGTPADMPGALPGLPTMPAETAGGAAPPIAYEAAPASPFAPNSASVLPVTPNSDAGAPGPMSSSPMPGDRYGTPVTSPVTTSPSTPVLPPAAPVSAQPVDRYGMGAGAATHPPAVTPLASQPAVAAGESFAASWPAIQASLDRRDLKQAHQLLSKWHADESLSPGDAQKVETLLGQLAGTVIYSTEHQLEPARVVKPGETLDSIAKEYNVPWQLLAKINSVSAPDQVRPGQQLKVVRGPFSAVVDLQRSEMSLEVGGCYAGTFPITVPADAAVTEGQWLVEQKLDSASAAPAFASAPPAAPYRRIILRNASAGATTAATLMIDGDSGHLSGQPGTIRVAMQDAEDLSDILSVGSRVTVRR